MEEVDSDRTVRELDELRWDVVHMPETKYSDLLKNILISETRKDIHQRMTATVEGVIQLIPEEDKFIVPGIEGLRARCPLCHDGPYQQGGYKLDAGLRQHLSGSGKKKECFVLSSARSLARQHVESLL